MRGMIYCTIVIGFGLAGMFARAAGPSASWEGLTGLFTMPTAETIRQGDVSFTFSELRFKQQSYPRKVKLMDTWYTFTATVGVTPRLEVAVSDRHEVLRLGMRTEPDYSERLDRTLWLAHAKYVLAPMSPHRPGLAIGVQDITDQSDRLDGETLERGRRIFVVTGYRWVNLGVYHQSKILGVFGGARLSVGDNIDLILEISSKPYFAHILEQPDNPVNFNMGIRFYPRDVPRFRADISAVGDGQFDLGFSLSYTLSP